MTRSEIRPPHRWLPSGLVTALGEVAAGRDIHLVGGALRDHVLGRPAADLDLVTDGSGARLGRRLADRLEGRFVALGGDDFAAYRIVLPTLAIDLWGRGAAPIEADLARRDLTINSIGMELPSGAVLDPHRGLEDLEGRRLRATTPGAFELDALRVLRLARFAATLEGFRAESGTVALARAAVGELDEVASERVREEVARTLASPGRATGVGVLVAIGASSRLWGPRPLAADTLARLADLEAVAAELERTAADAVEPVDLGLVAQALLFAAGTEDAAEAAGRSPLLTRRGRRRVLALLELGALPTGETGRRRFLHHWGRSWGDAALFAAAGPATQGDRAALELAAWAARHGRPLFDLPVLVDGHEAARILGRGPGPVLGSALAALERAQVDGRVTDVAAAREFLRSWSAGERSPGDPTDG